MNFPIMKPLQVFIKDLFRLRAIPCAAGVTVVFMGIIIHVARHVKITDGCFVLALWAGGCPVTPCGGAACKRSRQIARRARIAAWGASAPRLL